MHYLPQAGGEAPAMDHSGSEAAPDAATCTAAFIFLHGLGDSGGGMTGIQTALRLPYVKFVFPTAPTRPVTANNGKPVSAWFDVLEASRLSVKDVDKEGIAKAVVYLGKLVKQQLDSGFPNSRIVIGGFSQGGHVALKYLLSGEPPVAGCIALSTWIEAPQPFVQVSEEGRKTKVFIGQGSEDALTPAYYANINQLLLQSKGFEHVVMRTYQDLEHCTSEEELNDMREFLLTVIPPEPPLEAKRPVGDKGEGCEAADGLPQAEQCAYQGERAGQLQVDERAPGSS
eukprot:jgi/Botrbrau1/2151/Bobra.0093s0054.4